MKERERATNREREREREGERDGKRGSMTEWIEIDTYIERERGEIEI